MTKRSFLFSLKSSVLDFTTKIYVRLDTDFATGEVMILFFPNIWFIKLINKFHCRNGSMDTHFQIKDCFIYEKPGWKKRVQATKLDLSKKFEQFKKPLHI